MDKKRLAEIAECNDTGKMPIEWYQSQVTQLCAALSHVVGVEEIEAAIPNWGIIHWEEMRKDIAKRIHDLQLQRPRLEQAWLLKVKLLIETLNAYFTEKEPARAVREHRVWRAWKDIAKRIHVLQLRPRLEREWLEGALEKLWVEGAVPFGPSDPAETDFRVFANAILAQLEAGNERTT